MTACRLQVGKIVGELLRLQEESLMTRQNQKVTTEDTKTRRLPNGSFKREEIGEPKDDRHRNDRTWHEILASSGRAVRADQPVCKLEEAALDLDVSS